MTAKEKRPASVNTGKTPLILTISLYSLFFIYALSVTMIGPLVPVLMDYYHIALSDSGLITALTGIGGILSVILGVVIADRCKKSLLIKISVITYSLSVMAMAFVQTYLFLLILYFLVGASTKLLDAMTNAYVSDIQVQRRGFYMNLLHASYGLGAFAGPLITTALLNSGFPWHAVYLVLGIFCIVVSAFYTVIQGAVRKEPKPVRTEETRNTSELLKKWKLHILGIMTFLYVGLSAVFSTWMPSFMMTDLKADSFLASLPVSIYWLGIIAGRLSYSLISARLSTKPMLAASGFAASVFLASAVIVKTPVYFIVALFFAGLFCGAVIPLSVALGSSWYPKNTGTVSSLIFFYSGSGFLVMPWTFGIIAQSNGLYFSIASTVLAALLIAIFACMLPSKKGVKPQAA